MRLGDRLLLALTLLIPLLAGACAGPPEEPPPAPIDPEVVAGRVLDADHLPIPEPFEFDPKRAYYTRVGLWHEGEVHSTVNYERGTHLPVNSRVKLLPLLTGSRKNKVTSLHLRVLATGDYIKFRFSRYAKVSKNEILYRTFSPEPVDLGRLEDDLRSEILAGKLRPGMTRYQTLLTRGYPPFHRTPDLRGDTWEYWRSRYDSYEIEFSEGRLQKLW
jgi:hypothetical protein